MKKKLLSIMIAVVLLTALMSTVIYAATQITYIKVNVKTPINGGNWMNEYIPTIPDGSNYKLSDKWEDDGYIWRDETANKQLMVGDTFITGHKYSLTVYLEASNTNYEFKYTDRYNLSVSPVSNATVSTFIPFEADRTKEIGIKYEFAECSIIKDITANIDSPIMGSTPDYSLSWSSGYGVTKIYKELDNDTTISGVTWYDLTANRNLKTTDKFLCTHAYRVYIYFMAGDNYEFARIDNTKSSVNVTINTINASVNKIQNIGIHHAIEAYIDFPAISSHTEGEWITTKEPTCLNSGEKKKYCSACGLLMDTGTIPAKGHNWNNGDITKKATCNENGEKTFTCTDCGATKKQTIEKNSTHTEGEWITTKEPTCLNSGEKKKHCSVCGLLMDTGTIPAKGHSWNNGDITKKATCKETGVKTFICTDCGETKKQTIEKITTHTLIDTTSTKIKRATLTKNGEIKKIIETKCKVCNKFINRKEQTTIIYYPKTIKLKTTNYTYNGKVRKPSVIVTDSNGKKISSSNYTVTYSNKNSKNVGRYTVKIKFKGNYEGSKTLTYDIKPKGTTIKSLKKASKAFTVKWNKQKTQTTGYEIQYSTSSKFKKENKTQKISKNSTTSKKITKLKKSKKYYVRIRTYKTVKVSGKNVKIYSTWSTVKNIKTK